MYYLASFGHTYYTVKRQIRAWKRKCHHFVIVFQFPVWKVKFSTALKIMEKLTTPSLTGLIGTIEPKNPRTYDRKAIITLIFIVKMQPETERKQR